MVERSDDAVSHWCPQSPPSSEELLHIGGADLCRVRRISGWTTEGDLSKNRPDLLFGIVSQTEGGGSQRCEGECIRRWGSSGSSFGLNQTEEPLGVEAGQLRDNRSRRGEAHRPHRACEVTEFNARAHGTTQDVVDEVLRS